MKPALSIGSVRRWRAFGLVALAVRLMLVAPADVHAVTRSWTGAVSGFWSAPENWNPAGTPQDGDSLKFEGLQPGIFPLQSTNDLIDLQLRSIEAEIHNSPPYHIYGTGLIVSNGISARNDTRVELSCPITLASSQTFLALQFSQTARPTTLSFSGGINLNGFDLRLDARSNVDGISLGAVRGVGNLSSTGGGTISLGKIDATNTFTGAVNFSGGTLELRGSEPFGSGTSVATLNEIQVHLNTSLGVRPVRLDRAGITVSGSQVWSGPIELVGGATFVDTNSLIFYGPISGPGGLGLVGGAYEFAGSADNTYAGATAVYCTLLSLNKTGGARACSGELIVGGTTVSEVRWRSSHQASGATLTVHPNGLVNLNNFFEEFGPVTLDGGHISTGVGRLSLPSLVVNPASVPAFIDGNLLLSSSPMTTFTIADGPANPDLSLNAVISGGFGTGIRKTGGGVMTLHRANTYSGATLVDAGTLSILNNDALGAASQGTTVENGATVAFGIQVDTVLEPLTILGSGVGGAAGALQTVGDVWINTNLVLSGAVAIRTDGTNSRIQVNNISGTGPLTKLGSGRLVLRGNAPNTYTGDTLVTEGVLDLAKANNSFSVPGHLVIGTTPVGTTVPLARVEQRANFTIAGSVTVNAGGLWDLNGSLEVWLDGNLQGRPPLTLNDGGDVQTGAGIFVLPVGGDIVVDPGPQRIGNSTIAGRIGLDAGAHRIRVGQGGSSLFNGPECNLTATISENGAVAELEKDGGGTLRLAGTNSYRGATRVTGGALQVDGVQPQSAVRVFDGGRLQGVGTVGPVELLGATAIVSPGTTPGFLNTGSGILVCSDFNGGAVQDGILQVKLNGTTPGLGHDQINALGSVRLTGLTLLGSLGFASAIGQQFTIINNDGTDPVQGTFDGLAQNGSLYLGGERFTVSYTGGTGNDVVLTRQVTPQLVATTLPATEIPNFAVDFDGRFNRVHVGTNTFPTIANNFTIELWANPTAGRLATAEANLGISDLTDQRHAVFPDQGDLGYGAGHAGAGLSIGTNGISVFEHAGNYLPSLLVYSNNIPGWTHVALVYSNRQPRLFVNGSFVRAGQVSAKTSIHPSANLGGSIQGLTYGNFQGQLDEVRVWNGGLSQTQIQTNMNRSLSGSEPGLALYYRCEETNGVALVDSAPALPNLNGTLLNGVASVPSGALPPVALNGPTVTLNGLASPGGLDASVWFEWGATTNYGNVTATQSVSAATRSAGFSQALAGLAAGVYQFRAVGSNGLHFAFGQNQSLTLLNGAPLLSIESANSGQVRLLWPTNSVGFTLQANTDLNTTSWSAASAPPSVVGSNNVVLESTTGGQRFYRLFHP